MEAKNFAAKQKPWLDCNKFLQYLNDNNVKVDKGIYHNYSDGEYHLMLHLNDKDFELHANYWNYQLQGWQDAIDFVEVNKN
jgi:hypothetical protein